MELRAESLVKSFGAKHVLKGVTLTVRKGESVVVIGGSGSGKTVLLRCLIGLETPDAGRALAGGAPVPARYTTAGRAFMRRVGVLFQAGALFDSLPVWHNVMFSAVMHEGMTKREAMKRAEEGLEEVGLSASVLTAYPSELSGGMQKRVALARAVAHRPELIFFDEPTTGLDPVTSVVINELIQRCRLRVGASTFTITHDMKSAFAVADRIAMLHEGKIRAIGTPDEMLRSEDEEVRRFLDAAVWK